METGLGRAERFEELLAWKKARLLHRLIFDATRGPAFAQEPAYRSQLRRAALSVMANIAEGFERTGSGELHHFLSVAKGSCGEVRSHLYAVADAGLMPEQQARGLIRLCNEVGRITGGLRASVDRSRRERQ